MDGETIRECPLLSSANNRVHELVTLLRIMTLTFRVLERYGSGHCLAEGAGGGRYAPAVDGGGHRIVGEGGVRAGQLWGGYQC